MLIKINTPFIYTSAQRWTNVKKPDDSNNEVEKHAQKNWKLTKCTSGRTDATKKNSSCHVTLLSVFMNENLQFK